MFSQGGTAITYPVTGHDEYIRHNENALVAPPFEHDRIVDFLRTLATRPELLNRLRVNALATARAAIDWPESGARFFTALSERRDYSNAHLRPALQLMAAMGWQWLEGGASVRLSRSEERIVERYRRVKASAAANAARALLPAPLRRRVRHLLARAKAIEAPTTNTSPPPPTLDTFTAPDLSRNAAFSVARSPPPVDIESCEVITGEPSWRGHGVFYFGGDEAQMASDPTPLQALAHGLLLVARAPFPAAWGIEKEDDYLVRENPADYARLVRELNATPFLHQATRVRAWQKTRELFSAEARRKWAWPA
jgi:hypothetical protein